MEKQKIKELQAIISGSENIVFFGGAGVSTASGIPDFRSQGTGLFSQKQAYPPEVMLSREFFKQHTEEFYEYYKKNMIYPQVKPNAAHKFLAELEESGKLKAVITQNIDGLHQLAGSKNVLELHGSVYRNSCQRCAKSYGIEDIIKSKGIPKCECGGVIKPDVVLYGEMLPEEVVESAVYYIENADVLIIGGTSLVVYPAAGFVRLFKGRRLVLIDKNPNWPQQAGGELVIKGDIAEIMSELEV